MSEVIAAVSIPEVTVEVAEKTVMKVGPRDILFLLAGFGLGWGFKIMRNKYLDVKRKFLLKSLEKANKGLGKDATDIRT